MEMMVNLAKVIAGFVLIFVYHIPRLAYLALLASYLGDHLDPAIRDHSKCGHTKGRF
jgi:hypothetical protein